MHKKDKPDNNEDLQVVNTIGFIPDHPLNDNIKPDNYADLERILNDAYEQAANPEQKGQKRHGEDVPIKEQMTLRIGRACRGHLPGQAIKKAFEAQRLNPEEAIYELLGAINYLAFEIMILEDMDA